jgi:hypothetical protein
MGGGRRWLNVWPSKIDLIIYLIIKYMMINSLIIVKPIASRNCALRGHRASNAEIKRLKMLSNVPAFSAAT